MFTFLLGSLQFSRLLQPTEVCTLQFSRLLRPTEVCTQIEENFPFFLQLVEVIWETTANREETLTQSCAEKYEGFFALYRMKFDLVLQKL